MMTMKYIKEHKMNSSEDILNKLIEKAHYCYRRNFSKYCPTVYRMLEKKQPVTLNNVEYRCWKELVVVNIANLIQEYLPDSQCEVILDMNNSQLLINDLTPDDEKIILTKLNEMTK